MAIEIIEPGPEKSAWRDLLDARGPGFHPMGIKTRNLTKQCAYREGRGHELIQIGGFDASGGRYAYFDTMPQLGALIELLEFDDDMEPGRPRAEGAMADSWRSFRRQARLVSSSRVDFSLAWLSGTP